MATSWRLMHARSALIEAPIHDQMLMQCPK
jgi:hypothetical protein